MAPKKSSEYKLLLPAHKVTFEEIDLDLIDIDPAAQRETVESRLDKMEADFVPSACPPPCLASYTDSYGKTRYYNVDGGHRVALMRDRLGIKKFTCEVHHGLTQQQMAVLFIIRNREVKVPNAYEQYMVGVTGQLPLYMDARDVLINAKAGPLKMGTSPSRNVIAAASAVTTSVESYGKDALAEAIDLLDMTYGRADTEQWDGALIQGAAKFCSLNDTLALKTVSERMARRRETASAKNFKQEVLARTSKSRTGEATTGGTGSRYNAAARLIAEVYNRGIRTGVRAV